MHAISTINFYESLERYFSNVVIKVHIREIKVLAIYTIIAHSQGRKTNHSPDENFASIKFRKSYQNVSIGLVLKLMFKNSAPINLKFKY